MRCFSSRSVKRICALVESVHAEEFRTFLRRDYLLHFVIGNSCTLTSIFFRLRHRDIHAMSEQQAEAYEWGVRTPFQDCGWFCLSACRPDTYVVQDTLAQSKRKSHASFARRELLEEAAHIHSPHLPLSHVAAKPQRPASASGATGSVVAAAARPGSVGSSTPLSVPSQPPALVQRQQMRDVRGGRAPASSTGVRGASPAFTPLAVPQSQSRPGSRSSTPTRTQAAAGTPASARGSVASVSRQPTAAGGQHPPRPSSAMSARSTRSQQTPQSATEQPDSR